MDDGPLPLNLVLVIALHAAVGAGLIAAETAPARPPTAALMVRLIASAAPPTPPRPKPAAAKPVLRPPLWPQQRPLIIAPARAEGAVPESSLPLAAPLAAPAGDPVAVAADVPSRLAAVAPALSEPRFDASYLDNPAPAYPPMSRRLGEEGKVVLRVFVQSDGRPNVVEVKAGSGSPRLDEAATEAVRRWKFIPARRGADAVAAWVLVPIAFHLRG